MKLRTRFPLGESGPMQLVEPHATVGMPVGRPVEHGRTVAQSDHHRAELEEMSDEEAERLLAAALRSGTE